MEVEVGLLRINQWAALVRYPPEAPHDPRSVEVRRAAVAGQHRVNGFRYSFGLRVRGALIRPGFDLLRCALIS